MAAPRRRRRFVVAFAFVLARLGVSLSRVDSVLTDRFCFDNSRLLRGGAGSIEAMLTHREPSMRRKRLVELRGRSGEQARKSRGFVRRIAYTERK